MIKSTIRHMPELEKVCGGKIREQANEQFRMQFNKQANAQINDRMYGQVWQQL